MRGIGKGILLAGLVAWVGCAKEKETVVARVGEREIMAEDLKALAGKWSSPTTADKLLWTLIDREVMVLEAHKRGLDTNERIRSRIEGIKQIETTRLLKEELRNRIPISEEEAQRYYQERGMASLQEVKSRHIMVRTKEEAEEILEALKNGSDFAQLARERSLDKVSAKDGGDLGYWREGEVIGLTAQKVFSMQVGEISEPFKDAQGNCHVIEVLDKHPIGFEGLKLLIVNKMKEEKLGGVYKEYMDDLKNKFHLKIEPQVVEGLAVRCKELEGELEEFSEEERKKVSMRYDDKEVPLGDYLVWLKALKPNRSQLSDSSWVARSVDRFALDHILVPYAAHKEKIDQSEWLRSHLKRQLEEMMVTKLKEHEVDGKVMTPEVFRAYYESHKDDYYKPPKAVILGVLLDSLRWAQEAYERVKGGASMAEVAKDYPPFHNKYRNYDQFTRHITEENKRSMGVPSAEIELASRAEIGKINEPIEISFVREGRLLTGYEVVRVLKREPAGFEPLETLWVRRDIERKLRIAERQRIDELYTKWLTELRVTYNDRITIYQERLKSVELPTPGREPGF